MSPKIVLRPNLASEFELYAREAGITMDSAVNNALNEWMESRGRYVFVEMVRRRKAKSIVAGSPLRLVKGNSAIAS